MSALDRFPLDGRVAVVPVAGQAWVRVNDEPGYLTTTGPVVVADGGCTAF